MSFTTFIEPELQVSRIKPGVLTVAHAFQINGVDYDVNIIEEGLESGAWDQNLLVARVRAEWAQIVAKVDLRCFGKVEMVYDRTNQQTTIHAQSLTEGGPTQTLDGATEFNLNEFVRDAQEDDSFKRVFAKEGRLVAHNAAAYFFDFALKPHFVTLSHFAVPQDEDELRRRSMAAHPSYLDQEFPRSNRPIPFQQQNLDVPPQQDFDLDAETPRDVVPVPYEGSNLSGAAPAALPLTRTPSPVCQPGASLSAPQLHNHLLGRASAADFIRDVRATIEHLSSQSK